MNIAIICVNYNSHSALLDYLHSIEKAYLKNNQKDNLSIYIADNSCKKQPIKDSFSYNLIHLYSGKNIGYFGGVQFIIKKAKIELKEYDYIIVSNVDLKLSENFFVQLSSYKFEDRIGCVAPSIYSLKEKRDRNPKLITRPSKKKLVFQKLLYKYPILDMLYVKLLYSKRRKKFQNHSEGFIYAAHGSFFIFTNQFSDFLQKMKYPCFLFGEEIYLAENLSKLTLSTYYQPNIRVYDLDHVSTGKMKSRLYYRLNYLSIVMLLKEFY